MMAVSFYFPTLLGFYTKFGFEYKNYLHCSIKDPEAYGNAFDRNCWNILISFSNMFACLQHSSNLSMGWDCTFEWKAFLKAFM